MIQYDEGVVQQFAELLYKKAKSIETIHSILGILIGLFAMPALLGMLGSGSEDAVKVGMVLGILFGFLFGRHIGASKSLQYRVEAQQALCLAQIERNTRQSIQAPYDAATQLQARMMAQNPKSS